MSGSPTGYRHAGDYNLEYCTLLLDDGTSADLQPIASEINIFQELSSHYMSCAIVVDDALNIIGGLSSTEYVGGVNGVGAVVMRFGTTDEEGKTHKPIELIFGIYKVTNRARVKEKQETYTLHGISQEAYATKSQKISRAYGKGGGGLISNMITGIHKEFFDTKKPLDADSTKGLHKYVIPYMSVDDTIELMRLEAVSDSRTPYFFFYETFEGFKFKDLNTLVRQEPVEKYKYLPMNFEIVDKDNKESDAVNIMSFSIKTGKDYLSKIQNGQFKSKTLNIDLHRKSTNVVKFDYEKNFRNIKTFSNKKYPSTELSDDARYLMITSRTGHDSDSVLSAESPVPKKINQTKSLQNAYREIIFNQMISVTIPGDSNINAGQVIELDIPVASVTDDKEQDRKADKYLSGKFLVARVRHKMQGETYTTEIDCVRDAGDQL